MIAPIVVSALIILYYIVYFGCLMALLPSVWKFILGILPLGCSVMVVKVCAERINEIKRGEEDDLGQY